MIHWSAVVGLVAWFSLGAGGTSSSSSQYLLNAETTVHAESGVGTYDRTIHTELNASVITAGTETSLEVRRDNYMCVLRGARTGDTLALIQGQKCPQSIKGDGFQADLDGILQSGSATLGADKLILTTKWGVRGTVKLGPLSIPVTGAVSTFATGPRI